jgi:hypothetical protein
MMIMGMLTLQHYDALDITPALYLSAEVLVNFYTTFPDHTNS